ncbi:unnamed protein product, partial [Brassica napus]
MSSVHGSSDALCVLTDGDTDVLVCLCTDDHGRRPDVLRTTDVLLCVTDVLTSRTSCVCMHTHTDSHGRPACADGRPACADGRPVCVTDVLCAHLDTHTHTDTTDTCVCTDVLR